jgi:RNA polymerase sigma factor (sigma-70 family)
MTPTRPILSARSADPAAPSGRGERDVAALVLAARAGDGAAWTQLVERFDPMLRHIGRSYRLSLADLDDVVQATWLRLFKQIAALREPAALPGWLATTMRRECLRALQGPVRDIVTDDPALGECTDARGPEDWLLAAELSAALERALATLPERQRNLMTLLASDTVSYQEIGRRLDMPVGSIGPVRARALARLEQNAELRCLAV